MIERLVEWKKTPHDPKTHDQWDAVNVDAIIRLAAEFEYKVYYQQKYLGTFVNLSAAKRAVEERVKV